MRPRKGTQQSQLRRQLDSTQRAPRFSPEGTQSQPRNPRKGHPDSTQQGHPEKAPSKDTQISNPLGLIQKMFTQFLFHVLVF